MGCTIYAASPKALPADEAPGQDRYYQLPHYRHPHGNCSQRIASRARARSMTEQQEQSEETGLLSTQDLDPSKDDDTHGHFRFHLIEDLSYEDVKKCYRGSCVSCSSLLQALDVRECVCVYGANVLSLVQSSRPLRERVVSAASGAGVAGGGGVAGGAGGAVQAGRSTKELLMTLPCPSAQTVSKYNSQYHKLFQCVPKDEILMKVYSCALLRDILLQGRLYISRNWLCFYANLFGKDIKVAIPVVSVRLVKKHKTAGLVPNGLAITTDTGQKYVFVSLLSRDSVYDVLRRICTHLQVNGKSLSLKQFMEEPTLSLDEFPAPDEFPVVDEFPSMLKWRRKPSAVSVSSSLPDLLGNSSSMSPADTPFKSEQLLEERALQTDRGLLSEPVAELGQMEYQLLKFFTLLIILLILSSCYLAFRVCSLEQQLSFLSNPNLPLRER
ncbi:GRAM domain-containing protein 2A isoform X2 [Micropterus salmoides]|uniref:GRAM domain-containing protein 2A isoform X1 n=2 Tax=Micropterus salmoides TaxID=27706 RepID=UPI0018EB23FC|nr:GRAM domain-containing protein 2A isoform X1 [Micropterus salmoides]XP_038556418.1 GRAM domain-containing protein 2A isoform X2 [Micropterus salmoides]